MWPDNWIAVLVFSAMRGQWRSGGGGYYGLDMNVFPLYCQRLRVPAEAQDDVFQDMHVMESAALNFIHRKKPQ